jgi:hypothetical protein
MNRRLKGISKVSTGRSWSHLPRTAPSLGVRWTGGKAERRKKGGPGSDGKTGDFGWNILRNSYQAGGHEATADCTTGRAIQG